MSDRPLFTFELRPLRYVECLRCWGRGYIRAAAATCLAYDCEVCDGKGYCGLPGERHER